MLDPILTFIFILITWCSTMKVVYSCMDVLLESTPDHFIKPSTGNG
jgi:Co/Zn/Cd efflux system component